MAKYLLLVLVALGTFFSSCVLQAQEAEEISPEKQAVIGWVLYQAKTDMISYAEARWIVENAYWHSYRLHLDPALVLAVMRVESRFNAKASSTEGARGLMQVIPYWHKKALGGRSPYIPEVNIEVGVGILEACMSKSKGNMLKSLNCYSGGGGQKYLNLVRAHQKDLTKTVVYALFDKPRDVMIASN